MPPVCSNDRVSPVLHTGA